MTLAAALTKTEGLLTAGPEDSLAGAMAKIHSSHDAVFVTDNNKLLGVISAYFVLYRRHFPGTAKVKNCLFLAPKLKPETKIDEIARLMLESKVYFLPVVTDGGKWLGAVSYRRLLRQLTRLTVKPKQLVTCRETITLGQARNLMKKTGYSRLVVVTDSGRLNGILSRSDLNRSLSQPPSAPARPLIKRSVFTFRPQDNPATIVRQMLDKNIGSAVMVNAALQPIGILSIRDCLAGLAKLPPPPKQSRAWRV